MLAQERGAGFKAARSDMGQSGGAWTRLCAAGSKDLGEENSQNTQNNIKKERFAEEMLLPGQQKAQASTEAAPASPDSLLGYTSTVLYGFGKRGRNPQTLQKLGSCERRNSPRKLLCFPWAETQFSFASV